VIDSLQIEHIGPFRRKRLVTTVAWGGTGGEDPARRLAVGNGKTGVDAWQLRILVYDGDEYDTMGL